MSSGDSDENQKNKLSKITGDYYSDERIQRIFMYMFDEKVSSALSRVPFLLLDAKNDQSVRLSCSGVDGWSIALSQDKVSSSTLHASEHPSNADRAHVIESFLELETLLNHLMMIIVGAFSQNGDPKFSADVFSKLSIPLKLQLAKQRKLITPSTFKTMNRLSEYRNKMVHLISVSSLRYTEDTESNKGYYEDCAKIRDILSESYKNAQNTVIEYLLNLVESEQAS